jgi:hypothetical protein
MNPRRAFVAAALMALAAGAAPADEPPRGDDPGKGPRETVSTTLGGKKVTIEYGRPPLVGQTLAEIFGRLPPEKVWRAGVDRVTTLQTDGDLLIAGQKVPAGKYTLYAHVPEGGPWALLVNSDQGTKLKDIFPEALDLPEDMAEQLWPQLGFYEKLKPKEVARAVLKPGAAPAAPVERFQMTLAPESKGASTLTLSWGQQSWTAELKAAK